MKDPYEILGIPKNASKSRIKAVYKKKAQENHPDKGGDKDKFVEIGMAYGLLTDDSRREKYDRTGRVDNLPPLRIRALQEVANLVTNLVGNEKVNIDTEDLVLLTKLNLQNHIKKIKESAKNIRKEKVKFERARKRLIVKKKLDGEDPIINAMDAEIKMREGALQAIEQQVELKNECIRILDNYEYSFAQDHNQWQNTGPDILSITFNV